MQGRRGENSEEKRMEKRGRTVKTINNLKSSIEKIVCETQVFRRRTKKEINKERDTEHELEMKVWLKRSEGMQRVRANKQSSEQGELPWESSRECSYCWWGIQHTRGNWGQRLPDVLLFYWSVVNNFTALRRFMLLAVSLRALYTYVLCIHARAHEERKGTFPWPLVVRAWDGVGMFGAGSLSLLSACFISLKADKIHHMNSHPIPRQTSALNATFSNTDSSSKKSAIHRPKRQRRNHSCPPSFRHWRKPRI